MFLAIFYGELKKDAVHSWSHRPPKTSIWEQEKMVRRRVGRRRKNYQQQQRGSRQAAGRATKKGNGGKNTLTLPSSGNSRLGWAANRIAQPSGQELRLLMIGSDGVAALSLPMQNNGNRATDGWLNRLERSSNNSNSHGQGFAGFSLRRSRLFRVVPRAYTEALPWFPSYCVLKVDFIEINSIEEDLLD